jgi:hypothetical protein
MWDVAHVGLCARPLEMHAGRARLADGELVEYVGGFGELALLAECGGENQKGFGMAGDGAQYLHCLPLG